MESNHPPSILGQIPLSIESRLSKPINIPKIYKQQKRRNQTTQKSPIHEKCFNKSWKLIPKIN